MAPAPLTLRKLLQALGEMPADGIHDVEQNANRFDYSAQVRGFLVLKRAGIVKEVSGLVFRLFAADVETACTQLEREGVDLDAPLSTDDLGGRELAEVYKPSMPPPPSPGGRR
jgi:hypothetical protein